MRKTGLLRRSAEPTGRNKFRLGSGVLLHGFGQASEILSFIFNMHVLKRAACSAHPCHPTLAIVGDPETPNLTPKDLFPSIFTITITDFWTSRTEQLLPILTLVPSFFKTFLSRNGCKKFTINQPSVNLPCFAGCNHTVCLSYLGPK